MDKTGRRVRDDRRNCLGEVGVFFAMDISCGFIVSGGLFDGGILFFLNSMTLERARSICHLSNCSSEA